jgi:eukaryotic-like serine/threonine-protein kinase
MESIADYGFVRLIGEANYGEFYLARTPSRLPVDDEYVVVKVITGLASDDAFRRATRELRHFALVRSPKLVTIFDAGRQGSTFYYAMEYLPLGSLGKPARPLTREQTLGAVADAADAAHALHENGIAHRDIKPDNILLHTDGAKLSDLGLSQLLSPGLVMTGLGSIGIEFTDPAILMGGEASRATDVWALGAVLHRALSGFSLYGELPSQEPLLMVRAILASSPEPHASLSAEEANLVRACIAPDPTDRPATADEVAQRVRALI